MSSGLVAAQSIDTSSPAATSEEHKGFWQKEFARDLSLERHENSSGSIVFSDLPRHPAPQAPAAEPVSNAAPADNQPPPSTVSQNPSPDRQPSAQEIIEKYGAPETPRFIAAQKDAPAEFKGLLEALNIGDKDLAFRYAQAVARHNSQLASLVSKATEYQILAAEAEGLRPEDTRDLDSAAMSPERRELAALMAKAKQERIEKGEKLDPSVTSQLDEKDPVTAAIAPKSRIIDASSIPVDPQGRVKVLFFINERESGTQKALEDLKPLRTAFKTDNLVSFSVLTNSTYAPQALKKMSAALNSPFPFLSGEALGQQLLITSYPTVVFVAMTSRRTYRLEGNVDVGETEKVIRLMKGGK